MPTISPYASPSSGSVDSSVGAKPATAPVINGASASASATSTEKNTLSASEVRDGLDAPVDVKPGDKRGPELINDKVTILEKLQNPNYFGELDATAEFVLDPTNAPKAEEALKALQGERSANRFFSGDLSRLNSARFVNRYHRMDGDFRYAYGENAYRKWAEADAVLNAIPRGSLADELSVDLIEKVGAAAFIKGEEPLMERIGHAFRALQGHSIQPGALREYDTQTTPEEVLPQDEIDNIRALGLRYEEVGLDNGKGKAVIKYPPHKQMRKDLDALLKDTRAALKEPNADIIGIAARFGQKFIALHPLQDLNGRVGRLFMDRILAEGGLPPPILKDTGADYSVSAATYRSEVAKGVSRMVRQVNANAGATSSIHKYMAKATGLTQPSTHSVAPVMINGTKYALGADGFVYNEAGRAHLVDDQGVFQPLTQLQMYLAARRIYQAKDPASALEQLTGETRKAFTRATPRAQLKFQFGNDRSAMSADNAYRMGGLPAGNEERYVSLFNPARASPDKLFSGGDSTSKVSFALSRYQQIDHELYLVQHAAKASGDKVSAKTMQGYRARLFDMAKTFLRGLRDETRVSATNPNGFRYGYEKLQFEDSALSFETFQDAERAAGDQMFVYRGDAAAVQLTGIHPDGVFSHKDAKEVGQFREERNGTINLMKDLGSVLGTSGGTGYQSTTTDLGLLAKTSGFADKTDTFTVDMQALPRWLRSAVQSRLDKGETLSVDSLKDMVSFSFSGDAIPAGHLDISGVAPDLLDAALTKVLTKIPLELQEKLRSRITEARAEASEHSFAERLLSGLSGKPALVRVDDLLADGRPELVTQLQNEVANLRDFIMVRRDPVNENAVQLSSHRRAYKLEVDRDAGMVAPGTLGGLASFHNEQEISLFDTGMDSTPPWSIKGVYTQDELAKELPITRPDLVKAKPEGIELSSPPMSNPTAATVSSPSTPATPAATPVITDVAAVTPLAPELNGLGPSVMN